MNPGLTRASAHGEGTKAKLPSCPRCTTVILRRFVSDGRGTRAAAAGTHCPGVTALGTRSSLVSRAAGHRRGLLEPEASWEALLAWNSASPVTRAASETRRDEFQLTSATLPEP